MCVSRHAAGVLVDPLIRSLDHPKRLVGVNVSTVTQQTGILQRPIAKVLQLAAGSRRAVKPCSDALGLAVDGHHDTLFAANSMVRNIIGPCPVRCDSEHNFALSEVPQPGTARRRLNP